MLRSLTSEIDNFLIKNKIQYRSMMNSVSSGMEYSFYTSWNNSKPGCFAVMLAGVGINRSYRIIATDIDIEIKIKMVIEKWLEEYRELEKGN